MANASLLTPMRKAVNFGSIKRVAMVGNFLPRQCGIATFTTDLTEALAREIRAIDIFALAMSDIEKEYNYPSRVRFEIPEKEASAYRRAADFLNINDVDIVCVQHEYGIFGGKAGSHLLSLLRELRMPIVTTLHTILREPNQQQREVMDEIVALSDRLVVMSEKGAGFMREVHSVPCEKMELIHHGIPDAPFLPPDSYKEHLGVRGDVVILTFGLLGPDKGIENVIEALPEILKKHPSAHYLIVGATHPNIRAHHGETYRISLENLARKLGVAENVIFHNRFVTDDELREFIGAADIYITPYLKPEQITSGTLAYAVGSGRAVISTPYWYAEELLADGRGILVPWRDPAAIAQEVNRLLDNPKQLQEMRRKAADLGKQMFWPAVARKYMEVFQEARESSMSRQRTFHAQTLAKRPTELPEINLAHLKLLTDQTGILQHATFTVPNYDEGYCLDDNARALMLMAFLEDAGFEDAKELKPLTSRYLAFTNHAFNPERKRFRNFMSYDRQWLEDIGSEDSHGRAISALGAIVGRSWNSGAQGLSKRLFDSALPITVEFTSPRAWAFCLLGIDEYMRSFLGDSRVEHIRSALADKLFELYKKIATPEWPWFEDIVAYDNPRLSQALMVSGQWLSRGDMVEAGLQSLEWLVSIQKGEHGVFAPVGSNGFYRKGGEMAKFDQQPVEALAMVSACLDARRLTGEPKWAEEANRAFDWFVGQNELHEPVYDPLTGGCKDGLHPDRVNENEGAESTLSFLLSLAEMRLAENVGSPRTSEYVYTS